MICFMDKDDLALFIQKAKKTILLSILGKYIGMMTATLMYCATYFLEYTPILWLMYGHAWGLMCKL